MAQPSVAGGMLQGGLGGFGPARSKGPSPKLDADSLCTLCRNINFETLPSEDEPGAPHQPSLAALKASARTCTLCAMILDAAMTIRDDINADFNGRPRGAMIAFHPTITTPDGNRLTINRIVGKFFPGTTRATGGEPVRHFTKQFPFERDEVVKPWLFGSWWASLEDQGLTPQTIPLGTWLPEFHGPRQLIGLGVRLGRLPDVEYGEGNNVDRQTENGTLKRTIILRGTVLRIRTRFDSPFASYIPGRPITIPQLREFNPRLRQGTTDPFSAMKFTTIQGWLSSCDTTHHCMHRNTPLPTRILDVDIPGQNYISLVNGNGRVAPFLALSHRWGTSHRITLTHATIIQFMDRIALSSIPKTFNDAVQIARALKIRYLWIDSLCIIQDDHQDWEREASRMGNVYANAYLTIAPSFSEDDSSGCFPPPLPSPFPYLSTDAESHGMPPIRPPPLLLDCSSPGDNPSAAMYILGEQSAMMQYGHPDSSAEIIVSKEWMPSSLKSKPMLYCIPHFGRPFDEPSIQPLATRGWTLQERFLSPRTLHFTPNQMYWECDVCLIAEDGSRIISYYNHFSRLVYSHLIPWNKHGLGSVNGLSYVEGCPPPEPTGRWAGGWLEVIMDYTKRKLTVQNDKLPALSSLAGRLAGITGDKYLAGLWKGHIIEDLFWRVQPRDDHHNQALGGYEHVIGSTVCVPKRPAHYRAPSWSWASLDDAPVVFVPLDFKHNRILTTFMGADVTPAGSDPYGRVQSGWICLSGPLLTIQEQEAPPDYRPDPKFPFGFGIFMTVQTAGGLSYGEAYFDTRSDKRTQCKALFLDPQNAILLTPVDGADGPYRRLGIAKFLRTREQQTAEPLFDSDRRRLNDVPWGPVTNADGVEDVTII